MNSQTDADHQLLKQMGLRPVINAAGYPSRLGGARLAQEVVEAMAAAARTYVPIADMQARASELIEAMTGAEAGCVASGADACLTLAAAACITGEDLAAMDRLPQTDGRPKEIVVHRAQRNAFDHALRIAGGQFVEFGYLGLSSGVGAYEWQMHAAFGDQTAASFYVAAPGDSIIDFERFVRISHEHGVPVIVDAAPTPLPPKNFRRWIEMGADLIACAGGKYIGGPAASGFLAGRRELVRAATLQQQDAFIHPDLYSRPFGTPDAGREEPPHQGIGRVLKVGREELAGLMAALELCSTRDFDKERRQSIAISERVVAAINGENFEGVTARLNDESDIATVGFSTIEAASKTAHALLDAEPRVFVLSARITQKELMVIPHAVLTHEVELLEQRLLASIAKAVAAS